jgi:hypothetical protein
VSDLDEGTDRKDFKIPSLIGKKKLIWWGKKRFFAKILNIGMPIDLLMLSYIKLYHYIYFLLDYDA